MKKILAALAAITAIISLGACGEAQPNASSTGSTTTATQEAPKPADLTGTWKETNAKADTTMEATISGQSIEINWVSTDTKSLYWSGSFEAPTEAGDWKWTSKGDTDKMASSLLASRDASKDFSYSADKGELSFDVTAMGTTVTVRMTKG